MARNEIDSEYFKWNLYESNEHLILSVVCWHYVDYLVWDMKLNEEETKLYKVKGRDYIIKLADEIRDSSPLMRDSSSPYKSRRIKKKI